MNEEELIAFRDTALLPSDAGEYADDLMDILNRIPAGWGKWISCGPGWYPLLAETNKKMRHLNPNYEIYQVKEKFGTLRFYWGIPAEDESWQALSDDVSNTIYDIMMDISHQAENRSAYICESCGALGKTRVRHHWYKTLCAICAIEQKYPLEEWEVF